MEELMNQFYYELIQRYRKTQEVVIILFFYSKASPILKRCVLPIFPIEFSE
jgi:hypothetical protein